MDVVDWSAPNAETPAEHAGSGDGPHRHGRVRRVLQVGAGILMAIGANLVIAAGARSAGAEPGFLSLTPGPVVGYTVLGALAAVVGWVLVRQFVRAAATVLSVAVPVLTVLSLIPDLQFFDDPAACPTAAIALMLMHLIVVAVMVPVLQRILPVHQAPRTRP